LSELPKEKKKRVERNGPFLSLMHKPRTEEFIYNNEKIITTTTTNHYKNTE
jgi:hypothetical protein